MSTPIADTCCFLSEWIKFVTAYLIVRATVDARDKAAFDEWYETDHLPAAHHAFGSLKAWRGWCDNDPNLHFAFYEFATLSDAQALLKSAALKGQVADFDRTWEGRVTRTRETVQIDQILS